jgi:hypothetical protein
LDGAATVLASSGAKAFGDGVNQEPVNKGFAKVV